MLHNVQRCWDFQRLRWEKGTETHLLGATTWEESWRREALIAQILPRLAPSLFQQVTTLFCSFIKTWQSLNQKGRGPLGGELALASCNWPHQHRKHVGRLLSGFKASACKVIKSPKASANSSFTEGPSYVSVPFSSVAADEYELGT